MCIIVFMGGTILMIMLGLLTLAFLVWNPLPHGMELKKGPRGWALQPRKESSPEHVRKTYQFILLSRLIIAIAILLGIWLLARSLN